MRDPSGSTAVATNRMRKDTLTTTGNSLHGTRLRP
eukprot:COSAG06_NODE_65468_length_257_cov_0.544304_1_plen_34_part_10